MKYSIAILMMFQLLGQSCSQGNQELIDKRDFDGLTSVIYQLEESNRIKFKKKVLGTQQNSDSITFLNQSVIELYELLDLVVEDMLNESGGYNEQGVLIGGALKGLGSELFAKHQLVKLTNKKLLEMKEKQLEGNIANGNEFIEELGSSLSLITSGYWDSEKIKQASVAEIYLGLIIMQNRLLVTEFVFSN